MERPRHTTTQISDELREAEVTLAKGQTVAFRCAGNSACRRRRVIAGTGI